MSSLNTIWNKTVDLLKNELTEISLDTWIKTINPVSISNDDIVLSVPAEFNIGILKTRYYALIQNSIRIVTNKTYELNFVLPSESTKNEENSTEKSSEPAYSSILYPKYTFDTFVIGNGNQFAHAASLAVAESPGTAYNPLFLYSGVGLGKTHLMHAIGHYILKQNPEKKVLYVTSETFTNDLINAIREYTNKEFREKYRNMDVLLIDDIQFIGGKERTQEEFFHTFNTLYVSHKQIIIYSDKPPNELTTLEERLRSRFEWGLIADITAPDIETRIAILKKKAQLENYDIKNEVIYYIADNIASNIRELEGALNRVIAYASLANKEITLEIAQECLKQIISKNSIKNITCSSIQKTVARYFDINVDYLTSKKRSRDISYPRQVAMYLCRELTEMSLPKIGHAFGGRDHTTVMHACDKIQEDIEKSAEIRRTVNELKRTITGR